MQRAGKSDQHIKSDISLPKAVMLTSTYSLQTFRWIPSYLMEGMWQEMGDGTLASKMVGDGRLAPKTGGRWEVGPANRWEVEG